MTAAQDRDSKRLKPTPAAASQPIYNPEAPILCHLQVRDRAEDNSPERKAAIAVDYAEAGRAAGKDGMKVARKWEVDSSIPSRYLKQTKARDLKVKRAGQCGRPGLLQRRPEITQLNRAALIKDDHFPKVMMPIIVVQYHLDS